jgi:ATP-dependent protease ClpP protease subunit
MIKIGISDEIGYFGITANDISEQLKNIVDGEEIEITINSPGGSIFQGIAIFNTIREHAKTHPVSVIINGLAASMATYIAIAARTVNPESKVSVTDNSIFVIHNPYSYGGGDYREMKKQADYLERLAIMFAATYAAVSKQDQKKIRSAMDIETYYIGQEILNAGFANIHEKINPEENNDPQNMRESLIVNAKMVIEAARKKTAEAEQPGDYEKAVALLQKTFISGKGPGAGPVAAIAAPETTGTQPLPNLQIPEGVHPPAGNGGSMTPEELLAKDPECYKAVMALGEKAAVEKERERVNAHLKLGEKAGSLETAAKYIRDGASVMSEEVQSEYLSLSMNNKNIQNRNADDPATIHTGGGESEDDAKALAAFDAAYSGKEYAGGRK